LKPRKTSIKKILSVYKEILSDTKLTFGHKTQKSADFKRYLDSHPDVKLKLTTEDYWIVTMYANLNKINLGEQK
jgi:hypothetical protein